MTSDQGTDGEDRSVLGRPARAPDEVWTYGPAGDQVADAYLPDEARMSPVVLIHGGFWRPAYDRVHLRPMAAALADLGHPVLLPEYARNPGDPDAAVDDLRAAVAGLAGRLPGGPPVLVGHSAGGHLALLLGADPQSPVQGVLALAPVADLLDAERSDLDGGAVRAFLGGPAWLRPDLDPRRAGHPAARVRIVHGMADSLVPVRLSEAYSAAQGVPVAALPATGHFELIDPQSAAWPTVIAELAALAGPQVLND